MSITTRFVAGFLLAVMLFPHIGCQKSKAPTAKGNADANRQDGSVSDNQESAPMPGKRYQFEGFTFELPSDWKMVQPDRGKTKAMLLIGSDRLDQARGMIKADAGPPVSDTPDEMAKLLAEEFKGTIAEEEFDIDGERALRVSTNSTQLDAPREIFIAYREGRAFLVMGVGVKGTDVTGPIIDIIRSWKWSPQR